jgi:hypothetical protein
MSWQLGDDEAATIRRALDNYLPELRYELARVKLPSERHELVEFERKLTHLRRKLG